MKPYSIADITAMGGYRPTLVERAFYEAEIKFRNGAEPFFRQMRWLVYNFREIATISESGTTYTWVDDEAKRLYEYLEERVRLWRCECFDRNPDGSRKDT